MNQGFVTAQDGQFRLNGQRFRFVGTNAYYMPVMTAFGNPAYTDDVLAMATTLGFTVLRPFAFRNDTSVAAMQTALGVYQESGLRALDYVLHKADLAGIRLILPLANGQATYGGPAWYSQQCGFGSQVRPFYEQAACRTAYKNLITHVLNRVNFYNGRVYKNDPTVFAWELANEPHIEAEYTGAVTRAWVADIAAHIKSIDANHLVSVGDEGYDITTAGYSPVATTYLNQNWLFNGQKGLQWTANLADPNVNYGSIHLYAGHWNLDRAAGSAWITDHVAKAKALGKPLVLGEWGWAPDQAGASDEWLEAWHDADGDGALFWQLMPTVAYPMHDEFGVAYPPAGPVSDVLAHWAALAAVVPLEDRVAALEATVQAQAAQITALTAQATAQAAQLTAQGEQMTGVCTLAEQTDALARATDTWRRS